MPVTHVGIVPWWINQHAGTPLGLLPCADRRCLHSLAEWAIKVPRVIDRNLVVATERRMTGVEPWTCTPSERRS